MQVLTNLDLAKNELQNARIQNLGLAPTNPVAGQIYFNTADHTFYGWSGTAWIDLGQVLTGSSIISLLGYTPVKDGGSTPELRSGYEASRPTATGSGTIYFATDTKKIWKDTAANVWTQMGGQDLPIASASTLGGIKVGANLMILPDGTLNANDNPANFIIRQEMFTVQAGQTTFSLTDGTYKPGTNTLFWYMFGQKQPNEALIEVSPTSFQISGNLETGTEILVEYIELINASPFPYHANEHLSTGVDPISDATPTQDGLMSAADKSKLDGIAANANNYTHPSGDGNFHVPATGTTNNGKVLKAGATAGSLSWGTLSAADVGAVPTTDVVTTAAPNKVLKLDANSKLPASITGNADGNAATSTRLQTARSIALTGDASGSANFDGSANISISTTLANSGVTAGTYTKVTVDAKGRVTSAAQLAASDIPTLTLAKISDAGTAAGRNTGTAAGNVPLLDANGKIDTSVLPALVITDTYVVASQTAMLALTCQQGDVAVRTDINKSFILKGTDPTVLANWQELLTPTDLVQSVNGRTGAVTLSASDVGLGNVTNESKTTMFTSPTFTGTPTAPTPTTTDNSTKLATTAFVKAQGYLTAAPVTSVAGKTGAVTLSNADVGLGNVENKSSATIRGEISSLNVTTALGYTPTKKYAANIGDGSTTQFSITHNLGTMDVGVTLRENASPYNIVYPDIQIIDTNSIRLLFSAAPTSSQYRITIVG